MEITQENSTGRYQLRFAAGVYWLLDMRQSPNAYKRPMSMNEMGAEIWRLLQKNHSIDEIAVILSKEYAADVTEIKEDIIQFHKQLNAYGVVTGE